MQALPGIALQAQGPPGPTLNRLWIRRSALESPGQGTYTLQDLGRCTFKSSSEFPSPGHRVLQPSHSFCKDTRIHTTWVLTALELGVQKKQH